MSRPGPKPADCLQIILICRISRQGRTRPVLSAGPLLPKVEGFLASADYSQIELRILAHFSEDPALVAAFNQDMDVHKHTAGLIFQVEEGQVTSEMRDTAKRINFGIIYGMSSFGLSKDLGIPAARAQEFIDNYFLRYPRVKDFIDSQIKSARELGYARTLLGRRRSPARDKQPGQGLALFCRNVRR